MACTDVQEIWQQWIRGAYAVPDEIFESTASMCAFETFWERLFDRWDVKKLRKQLRKRGSDVGRSLGGLAGVGVALAFSERDTASVNATSDV